MFILSKVRKGDVIKLSRGGMKWTVWHIAKSSDAFLPVIQLKSEKGSFRTYTPKNTNWNRQVWYV